LQVFAADLGGGPNPVAQFPHNLGKRVEGRAARLSRQMGTAQLIADPLLVRLQLSFPTHLSFLLSSNWCASFHWRPAVAASWRKPLSAFHLERPDANTSGQVSFVASQPRVPEHARLPTLG
jgi:hypothetical protein